MSQPPLLVSDAGLDLGARTLYGECRGEPRLGQQAVAWVLRNRVQNPAWWGNSLETVCLKPQQFSCWNTDDPNCQKIKDLAVTDPQYQALRAIVASVFFGDVDDPTDGADHYEVLGTGAAWAKNQEFSKIIGAHAFYKIGPHG